MPGPWGGGAGASECGCNGAHRSLSQDTAGTAGCVTTQYACTQHVEHTHTTRTSAPVHVHSAHGTWTLSTQNTYTQHTEHVHSTHRTCTHICSRARALSTRNMHTPHTEHAHTSAPVHVHLAYGTRTQHTEHADMSAPMLMYSAHGTLTEHARLYPYTYTHTERAHVSAPRTLIRTNSGRCLAVLRGAHFLFSARLRLLWVFFVGFFF